MWPASLKELPTFAPTVTYRKSPEMELYAQQFCNTGSENFVVYTKPFAMQNKAKFERFRTLPRRWICQKDNLKIVYFQSDRSNNTGSLKRTLNLAFFLNFQRIFFFKIEKICT